MDNIYTVDQVAKLLGLKAKTIRKYIAEGKLKAEKIGKQWRIEEKQLSDLMNIDENLQKKDDEIHHSIPREKLSDKINVSAVVEIKVKNEEEASNICNMIIAMLNSKDSEMGNSSFKSIYNKKDNSVKLLLWGKPKFISILLEVVSVYEE